MLTLQDLADELNISNRSARRLVKRGEIHAINVGTDRRLVYRIPIPSLCEFIVARTVVAKAPKRKPLPEVTQYV